MAVIAVAVLLAAGVLNGFLEVRSWQALWETTYGQLLLVKVGLVAVVLAFGAFNNRISVPRLRTGMSSPTERRRFLASTATELTVIVAVVALTAALVAEPPAKAQMKAAAGPEEREATVGPYHLDVVVDPAMPGTNEIHLYLLDHHTGQPAKVDETRVFAPLPAAGRGTAAAAHDARRPRPRDRGRRTVALRRAVAPTVDVRKGEFDQWSTNLTVPIRKDTEDGHVRQFSWPFPPHVPGRGGRTSPCIRTRRPRAASRSSRSTSPTSGAGSTTKIDVQFPNGIYTASVAPIPGWRGRVITKKLDKPAETKGLHRLDHVDRVVFGGGRIRPGQFLSFPFSIRTHGEGRHAHHLQGAADVLQR